MLKIEGFNIRLTRGDYASIQITCRDEDSDTPHIFVEGETVTFRMRTPKFSRNCPIDIGESTCTLIIEEEDTANWDFGTYRYELEYRDVNGKPDTFIANESFTITNEQEDHNG